MISKQYWFSEQYMRAQWSNCIEVDYSSSIDGKLLLMFWDQQSLWWQEKIKDYKYYTFLQFLSQKNQLKNILTARYIYVPFKPFNNPLDTIFMKIWTSFHCRWCISFLFINKYYKKLKSLNVAKWWRVKVELGIMND